MFVGTDKFLDYLNPKKSSPGMDSEMKSENVVLCSETLMAHSVTGNFFALNVKGSFYKFYCTNFECYHKQLDCLV